MRKMSEAQRAEEAKILLADAVASMAFEDMEPPAEQKEIMLKIICGEMDVNQAVAETVKKYCQSSE